MASYIPKTTSISQSSVVTDLKAYENIVGVEIASVSHSLKESTRFFFSLSLSPTYDLCNIDGYKSGKMRIIAALKPESLLLWCLYPWGGLFIAINSARVCIAFTLIILISNHSPPYRKPVSSLIPLPDIPPEHPLFAEWWWWLIRDRKALRNLSPSLGLETATLGIGPGTYLQHLFASKSISNLL